jgi:hypothetical protein
MPNPASTVDPQAGLRLAVGEHLIPLFRLNGYDSNVARYMAHAALDAYYPEIRADFVNAARTIAFSMAAIALLGKAVSSPDLTMAEQMQAYTRASALNRSADDSERSMMQRRKYHQANPQPEPRPLPNLPRQPEPVANRQPEPKPEPELGPRTRAEIDAQVAEVMQEYRDHCASLAAAKAAAGPAPVPPAAATATAIRDTGPPGKPQLKDSLLRGSTLHAAAGSNGVAQPGSG